MNGETLQPPCLAKALRLVELGYRVFPINPNDKQPLGSLVPHGLKNATLDEATVRSWRRRRPDANLAVATYDCCVVDIDPCDGKPNPWLNTLDEPLVTNMTSTTPRGGSHLWFADPTRSLKNSTSKLAQNVDTRATGGYVLVSPSTINGASYNWASGPVPIGELLPPPDWLIKKLMEPKPNGSPVAATVASGHQDIRDSLDIIERARKYIRTIPPAISGNGGHPRTFLAAQHLVRGFDLSDADAFDLLAEWNQPCVPPWSEGELRSKIQSARSDGTTVAVGQHLRPSSVRPPTKEATSPPRILAAGERVLAGDIGNIGTVVSDDGGSSVTVHFVSPEGKEATKDIPRSQLKTADGRSVVPVQPIRIRAAGELIGEFSEMRPAILEGLLRCGETMNIIAAPKTGKSWLSAGLGLSVVSGRKWLDRFWTRRGKVLIVDNELHPETSAQRLPHIAREMGIQRDEYADQLFVANLRGQLIDLEALAEQLSRLEPGAYSMIVLDAWYRFQPSGSDENSNGDVTQLYNLLDSVADKIGSAFVCIHHSSKGNQSGKGVTDVGSGAGAQSRAPDSHLTIRQHEEDGAVVVEAAVRSFAPMEPFCLRWNFPVWTPANDLDPKDLRQERPRKAKGSATESDESPEDLRKQRDQENRQKVLDAYATFPDGETASVVKNAAGMNGSVFGPIHAQLIRDGLVRTCKIQKNRQAYDGACLVKPKPLGHSDKTLFSVSESECPTEGGIGTRTSRPPLGAAVCPSPHPQVGGLVCLPVGKESECPSEIAHELANELFPVEAT